MGFYNQNQSLEKPRIGRLIIPDDTEDSEENSEETKTIESVKYNVFVQGQNIFPTIEVLDYNEYLKRNPQEPAPSGMLVSIGNGNIAYSTDSGNSWVKRYENLEWNTLKYTFNPIQFIGDRFLTSNKLSVLYSFNGKQYIKPQGGESNGISRFVWSEYTGKIIGLPLNDKRISFANWDENFIWQRSNNISFGQYSSNSIAIIGILYDQQQYKYRIFGTINSDLGFTSESTDLLNWSEIQMLEFAPIYLYQISSAGYYLIATKE
jgi:hypothetical protein